MYGKSFSLMFNSSAQKSALQLHCIVFMVWKRNLFLSQPAAGSSQKCVTNSWMAHKLSSKNITTEHKDEPNQG